MKPTTAQRFGSLGKSFGAPAAAAAVIGAALLASDTSDTSETTWSPAAACLLPDVLPIAGTLLSYGGSRQLAAGGTVTHSVPTASTKGLILKTTDDSISQPIFDVQTSAGTSLHRIQGSYAYFANLSVASGLIGSMINVGNTGYVQWGSRSIVFAPASSQFSFRNLAQTAGATLDVTTDGTLAIKDRVGTAAGNLTCGAITASGNVTTAGDLILASGTTGIRLVYNSSGVGTIYNHGGTDFGRLNLGGTTSSFPAIKRSGTTTAFRLADDSADGPIACAAITASGAIQETPTQSALDPTTTNIPSGKRQGWYNSTLSEFRDWVNIGGTLLKSAAYT